MKLLVSDYDGTFYTTDRNIKINVDKIREWIKNGNLFMLSSGRSYNSIMGKINQYDIPYSFISSEDGSHLFDKSNNVIHESIMDSSIVSSLDKIISLGIHDELQFGTKYEYLNDMPNDGIVSSINFALKKAKVTDRFIREWNLLKENNNYSFLVYGYNDEIYYCIKPKNVDKGSPISFLEKYLPISKSQIYTVGDGDNDISMIKPFNGYVIGKNNPISIYSMGTYNNVHELVDHINKKLVKKRWK